MAFFKTSADKGNACSNLCEEQCKHFKLIFLLLLIFPEHYFISHFAQHSAHSQWFFFLSFVRVDGSLLGASPFTLPS
jgi:hypothetical protein